MPPSNPTSLAGSAASPRRGLIAWFINNPVAANLLMVVLLVGGALSALNLRSQVFPTISPGTVVVTVPFPGATPAEVEEGVTRRVEEAVLGIDGVKRVTSNASENVGIITIETNDFADRAVVKDDVESAVDRLSDFPPENAEKPVVVAPKPTGDVVTLAVVGDVGEAALRRAAEEIERDLLSQRGVSLVSIEGARDYEISIEISEATLRRYGLSFSEVASAVRRSSLDHLGFGRDPAADQPEAPGRRRVRDHHRAYACRWLRDHARRHRDCPRRLRSAGTDQSL